MAPFGDDQCGERDDRETQRGKRRRRRNAHMGRRPDPHDQRHHEDREEHQAHPIPFAGAARPRDPGSAQASAGRDHGEHIEPEKLKPSGIIGDGAADRGPRLKPGIKNPVPCRHRARTLRRR